MSKLVWDQIGEHWFEQGVQKGVLYPQENGAYPKGVAWNGLRSVEESPSGAESNKFYADNDIYLNILSKETYECTIGAYTYPPEWEECDGSAALATGVNIRQQTRKGFGFCFRTEKGNDTDAEAGYILHLVYGCLASPSSRTHESINDSPAPAELSWTVSTVPVPVTGHDKTATLEIDSTTADATKLAALEDILYGTAETEARLPLPDEIATLFATNAVVEPAEGDSNNANGDGTDNGDGNTENPVG